VLVMRLDNIGDVVMLSPALRSLRETLPNARVTLLTSPAGARVSPMLPWIDETRVVEAVWQDASDRMPLDPEREQRFIAALRADQYDAALIFTSFSQSPHAAAYACYLAGIPVRIGESKEFGGSVLTHAVRPNPEALHQAERNLRLLEHAGIESSNRELELRVPVEAASNAEELLAAHGATAGERFVAVAPGASCAARRYDKRRFANVVSMLSERFSVVLLGSERERALTHRIRAESRGAPINLGGRTTLTELAAVIDRASVLIANDSGPMHIADALDTPTVVLFSGTELESQWAPRRARTTILRQPTHCSPCYAFECPFDMQCLDIAPEAVVEAALRILGEPDRTRPEAAAVAT
jgi:lipopolysaccharide heptosyltransferase II